MKYNFGDIVMIRTYGDNLYEITGWDYHESYTYGSSYKTVKYTLKHVAYGNILTADEAYLIYFGNKTDNKIGSKDIDRCLDEYNLLMQEYRDYLLLYEEFKDPEHHKLALNAKNFAYQIMRKLKGYNGVT